MSSTAHLPDLTLTYGAVEIGTFAAIFLLGVGSLQTWNYFRTFSDDSISLKSLVGGVYVAELIHSALLIHCIYYYTITSFGNYAALPKPIWSLLATVPIAALIAFAVQTFYALRVLRVTESKILASGCWILALARLVFMICISVTVGKASTFAVTEGSAFKWQIVSSLSVGAASDVAIALCICISLLKRRSGFISTDRIVEKLIAYTIGSGLMTSIVAVAELITYLTLTHDYTHLASFPRLTDISVVVWIACFTVISKMLSNSLLVSLNQRSVYRAEITNMKGTTLRSGTRMTFERQDAHELHAPSSFGPYRDSLKAHELVSDSRV